MINFQDLETLIGFFNLLSHKMVKHPQTIRRLLPTNFLSVLDHFVGMTLKD